MSSESEKLSKIDRARVPALIAQFLPVEICIYYQVVPIATDGDMMVLGMVDPEDLAALDYVGKMVGYSELKIEPMALTFQQQQDLIAYYFSHPPDPTEVAALKASEQASRTVRPHLNDSKPLIMSDLDEPVSPSRPTPTPYPTPTFQPPTPSPTPVSYPTTPPTSFQTTPPTSVSAPTSLQTSPPEKVADESDETVQQLLHSMLRRALDDEAEQLFVEPSDGDLCRIRYRQKGILRELFKQLSDIVRVKLIASMKQMMGIDPQVLGETQVAEVDRVYRGEPLVLQLRIVPQKSKEGMILNILRGESLAKYQQSQNKVRVAETLVIAQQTQQMVQQLQMMFASTVEKLKQYPSEPREDWQTLTITLDAIRAQVQIMESYQQDWRNLSSSREDL